MSHPKRRALGDLTDRMNRATMAAIPVCLSCLAGVTLGQAPHVADGDAAEFARRVESLSRRVDELAPDGASLDSLHFGWFDRPHARLTLATLVKTSAVLQREVRMRNAGDGPIPAARLGGMLQWAEDAIDHMLADEPDPKFRPHRIRVTPRSIVDGMAPPLFAFLDRATATRSHVVFGDLDLMAALGQRAYVRKSDDRLDATHSSTLARRVGFLGMVVVDITPNPIGAKSNVSAIAGENALQLQPRTLAELLSGTVMEDANGLTAVIDPVAGEQWPSRIARRALARGVTGRSRFCASEWNPSAADVSPSASSLLIASVMWLDAMEGVSLAVADGWRDLRDGSISASPSVFTRPEDIESFAHTALDMLRVREVGDLLKAPRPVALVLSPDAVDANDSNQWAEWIVPFFASLVERQIPFDVVSSASRSASLKGRYSVIFSLTRDDALNMDIVLVRLEREIATDRALLNRAMVRELDGRLPHDLYVRIQTTDDNRPVIGVVNLSLLSRELIWSGDDSIPPLHDAIHGSREMGRDGHFSIGPWQPCLFTTR